MEIKKAQLITDSTVVWTKPVIGLSLLVMGGGIDSDGRMIEPTEFYKVGKHPIKEGAYIVKAGDVHGSN